MYKSEDPVFTMSVMFWSLMVAVVVQQFRYGDSETVVLLPEAVARGETLWMDKAAHVAIDAVSEKNAAYMTMPEDMKWLSRDRCKE